MGIDIFVLRCLSVVENLCNAQFKPKHYLATIFYLPLLILWDQCGGL